MLGAVVVGGPMSRPYSVLSPGDATAGEPLVHIQGHPVYPHRSAVLFVTVNVSNRVSAAQALWAWIDPDQAVDPSNEVIGTHTQDEDFRQGVLDMRTSKEAAVVLALRHLGYQVPEIDRGALVYDVSRGTPAYGALKIGDTITAIDGAPIATVADLRRTLATHAPGDHITVSVGAFAPTTKVDASVGPSMSVPITLASAPDDPHKAFLGITPMTDAAFTLPFQVDIDTGAVGGPSAGLAFTLTLIDRLSPNSIVANHKVAVTGTIELDGKVGAVGGVPQKTIAVRRAGADIFLVPSSEYKQAKANAGKMRVVKVDTLDQALAFLRTLDTGG